MATAWDAPAMIARFYQVIDALAANISPSSITWISIGNEVDVYLASTNQSTWSGIGGNKIPFLNIFLMHDFTQALCDYWNAFTQAATDTGLP
jgi:hypothetical protein